MLNPKKTNTNKHITLARILQYMTRPISLIYLTATINIIVILSTPTAFRFTPSSYIRSLLWSTNIMYFLFFLKLYLIHKPKSQPQVIEKSLTRIFFEQINQIAQQSHAWPIFLYSLFIFPILLASLFTVASLFPNAILLPTILMGLLIFLTFLILFLFVYFLFKLLWVALGLIEIIIDL